MNSRILLLVAGPSGSGKSRLCRLGGNAEVSSISLDDFYHDHDFPGLPRTLGIVDWDDVASFDLDAAVSTLSRLLAQGEAEVPVYDISTSRRTGMRHVAIGESRALVAEGIFAIQTLAAARAAGLRVEAIWLDRPRANNFVRRLVRDLKERRKPPAILVRRGAALFRAEPGLRTTALAAGFQPMGMRAALGRVSGLAGEQSVSRS